MASSARKNPDREGFLRRLEGGGADDQHEAKTPVTTGKKVVRIDEKKPIEDEALQFLQQAGLGASPMDPSSLAALRELCSPKEEEKVPNDGVVTPPPVMEIQTNAVLFRRQTSDLTQTRRPEVDDWRTDATTAGSVDENRNQATDRLIVNLLENQTALLMDVQRQLEELKQTVAQLQQQHPTQQQPQPTNKKNVVTAQPRAAVVPPPAVPQQQVEAAVPQPHPQQQQMFFSKFSEIIRVFWAMQRRQVNLDGGMLFKVLFMALILSSRMSKKGSRNTSLWSNYRSYLGVALVVLGFLVQSGYVSFLHNFFVKQNIPGRVWNGETINVEEAVAPRRPQPANQPRDANQEGGGGGVGGWRHTFFGGAIQPAGAANDNDAENNNNNVNPVFGLLQDILYLLGSFVLSILPMWKPEGIQHVVPAAPQEDEGQEEGDADVGEPEQRAPDQRDAMQPLEEDEPEDDIYAD